MKKLGFMVLGVAVSSIAMASVCTTQPGIVKCGVGEAKEVVAYGLLDVKGSHINGDTSFSGALDAKNGVFRKIDGNGMAKFEDSSIQEESKFKGSISSKNTKFEKNIHIYSNTASFDNSTAKQSVVFHKLKTDKRQRLFLRNGSVVSGEVNFRSGNGEVVLEKGSKVEGKVVGGKIVHL